MAKENTDTISTACEILAQTIREIPCISGLFTGTSVYVYSEADEDFAGKLEAVINQNLGVAIFVRSDGWSDFSLIGNSCTVTARFAVRVIASTILNADFASSITELTVAIAKAATGVFGDNRFISPFIAGDMSAYENGNTITRELTLSARIEI